MKLKVTFIFFFLLMSLFIEAQPPSKFYCRYGGNGYDVGYDVKQTLDNGYIITGSTSSFGQGNTDMYLLKLDSMGQRKFETSFGGYSNEIGKSIVQLSDSSYVMVGYTSSTGVGGYDIFLVKADKSGNLVWQKTIGGADWDFAYSLQATTDGGFIIAGTTYSFGHGNADGYIIKTNSTGDTTWTKTYGGLKDDEFKSVIQTADGNYALTGYTKSYNDSLGDAWVFKIDINGDSLLCKFHGGNKEDIGNGIIQLQNSNILVSGSTRSSSANGNRETMIITFDYISGTQIFIDIDVSNQDEYHNGVAQGINGIIANCGATKNVTFGYDALVDIYKVSYNFLNFFSEGSTMYEEFFAISQTKDKGFVAVGKTTGYNSVLEDVFFMKMDSLGSFGSSIISVKENSEQNISLNTYPNPASDYITIDIPDYQNYKKLSFRLIDINGRVVLSSSIDNPKSSIDISQFSNGLYFIQIFNSNNLVRTLKLSIVK